MSWTTEELKASLRGALAFPITPFDESGAVDLNAVLAGDVGVETLC